MAENQNEVDRVKNLIKKGKLETHIGGSKYLIESHDFLLFRS